MFCTKCGRELGDGDAFCAGCGAKVGSVAPAPAKQENFKTSEGFLREKISERRKADNTYHVEPEIPEKILVNAANKIACGVNPAKILAVCDSSLMSNGKEGVVFTGVAIYAKETLGSQVAISLKDLKSSNYNIEVTTDSNGKEHRKGILTVTYNSGEEIVVTTSDVVEKRLAFIAELLEGIINNVEEISEKSYRYNSLSELGDDIIGAYINVICGYLKADDGIISSVEYKELISLMARINVSRELSDKLRKTRLNINKTEESFKDLVDELDSFLKAENLDNKTVFQSLFKDLLLVRPENLEEWKMDKALCELKALLGVTDSQADVLKRSIETDRRIVDERLEDSQIKDIAKEVAAVAGGAGVTLAALAVTGGVSSGIWGGLFTLGMMSTGGMLLGLAAIGGVGYGAYKGIKYFAGTSQLEKSGIRIAALQSSIENNKKAVSYIMEDINWLTRKISEEFAKVKELNRLNDEITAELADYLLFAETVGESGDLLHESNDKEAYEINIAKLPMELPLGRFTELVAQSPDRTEIETYILSIYQPNNPSENGEQVNTQNVVYRREEELSYDDARKTYNYLNLIGFYDTKASAVAQGQAITKKGIEAFKSFIGG